MLNTYIVAIATGLLLAVQVYYVLAEVEISHGKPLHLSHSNYVNHSDFSG